MKKGRFCILFFNLLLFSIIGFAQTPKIDSLLKVVAKQTEDTTKVLNLIQLCDLHRNIDPDKSIKFGEEAIALSVKLKYIAGEANALKSIGIVYWTKGDLKKALEIFGTALSKYKEINDELGTAKVLINIGLCYDKQTEYGSSLTSYLEAQRILEKLNDKENLAKVTVNIGLNYYNQGNYANALTYTEKGRKMYAELGNKNGEALSVNNLGLIYEKKANQEHDENVKKSYMKKAREYYMLTLKAMEEMGNNIGISKALINIGNSYAADKSHKEALKYYKRAMSIQQELGDRIGLSLTLFSIAMINQQQGNYDEAIKYNTESITIAREIGIRDQVLECYLLFSSIYADKGNYKLAYEYKNEYSILKDSIFNENNQKAIAEMQTKYDTEKKEKENELLMKKGELQEATLRNQRIVIFGFIGFAILILLLAFYIYRGYREKQKANKILEAKNAEIEAKNIDIEKKNIDIEKKNKDIMDSIKYAQRIQHAILPSKEMINRLIPESFILFRPKSIVSGDFYWLAESQGKVLFSAVDCTGHGVPGALVSIVGNNILKQAINEQKLSRPADILNFLSKGVNQTLRQTNEESTVKDGMDLAMCAIDKEKMILEFAGVHNPMYLVRNGEVIEFKPDKYPIGEPFTEEFKSFNNTEFQLQKGDTIYVFSDGYIDQFGGPNKKKFLSKKFREVLVNIQHLSMPEQKEELVRIFEEWIGDGEQIDDVLVFGVRV